MNKLNWIVVFTLGLATGAEAQIRGPFHDGPQIPHGAPTGRGTNSIGRPAPVANCFAVMSPLPFVGFLPVAPFFQPRPARAPIPPAPQPLFAANLGIYYTPLRHANGTFSLQLSAAPVPGSPISQLTINTGDVVFAIDGQRFMRAADVAEHFDQITVDYIDSTSNAQLNGTITLPPKRP